MSGKINRETYEYYMKRFCLMDDVFMTVVFRDKECAQELLSTILDMEVEVIEVNTQYELKSLHGRSARLDILAKDKNGRIMNVEIQNAPQGAIPERARFNMSLIDSNELEAGDSWEKLPDTYVIFITKDDVLGGNLPIYHIERFIKELDYKPFGDRSHIIYVNSEIQNETALGRLMYDLHCTEADKINNPKLSKVVSQYKDFSKGVKEMSEVMMELKNEGIIEGKIEGILEGKIEAIKSLMKNCGFTATQAMKGLSIPENEYSYYLNKLELA